MKRHLSVSFALLLLAAPRAVYPQTSADSGTVEMQQSSSVDCTDPLLATGGECAQGESLAPREAPGLALPRPVGRTASARSENATLGGKDVVLLQERALPPDQPTEFQDFVAATTGQQLPIYGASLFRNVPSTFSPSDQAPVTPEYVIGPDDELRIRIWGQITYSGNLRVDRSGNIYLPQTGMIHVAGLQFSALDRHIREAVGRTYRNFDLSVDIGRIRSMQVYVTGQARRPGVYTLSALSSLVNALFASGGPSPQGTLRHILVNRNGKTIADFDLYSLLIHGDKSKDVQLQPEDVLNIPAAGPQVAITGSIRNPAIYELREGETVGDLIEAAGKTTAMSSRARISLERVEPDQLRQAMEFGFDARSLATPLADGDILRIYPILPAYQKTVTLRGNVANSGRFSWRPGMRLSDIIPDRDSLVSRDYWWKRSNLGLPVPTFEATQETPTPGADQTASHGSVAIQSRAASVPGGTAGTDRNDVRLSAPEINWDYAVIERLDPKTLKSSLIPFDLGKLVLNHDENQNLALEPGDTISIFSQFDIRVPLERQTKYVDLEGEFIHAGTYSVRPGETLRDLVQRAGGLTPKAYLYGSEFTRETTRVLQQQRIDEYIRTVTEDADRGTRALAMSGASSQSGVNDVSASRVATQELTARLSRIKATGRIVMAFHPEASSIDDVPTIALENGDKFVVPFAPATVNVVGAVYDQNSFLYHHRQSLGQYLQRAGGPNRNADRKHAFLIRADGSVVGRTGTTSTTLWSGNSFTRLRLYPGDTIVVPEKTLRPSALRGALDWTQVFSQLALGSAAISTLNR